MLRAIIAYAIFLLLASWTLVSLELPDFANDPGLGWHLLTGQQILETGEIPRVDTFLFSPEPRAWISDQWLSDLLIYKLYQLGGWQILYGILALLYLAIYFVFAYRIALLYTGAPIASALAAFISFKLGLIHFILRPVIFGHLVFALVLYCLFRLYSAISSTDTTQTNALCTLKRLHFFLPPIFVIAANVHPSFCLALGLIVLLMFCLVVDKIFLNYQFPSEIVTRLLSLTLLCALATLLNPYGSDLQQSIIGLGQNEFFMNLNSEWRSLNFRNLEGELLMLALMILVIGVFIRPIQFKQMRTFELTLLLIFIYLSTQSVRFLPYCAIVLAPLLANAFAAIWQAVKERYSSSDMSFTNSERLLRFSNLIFAIAVAFFVLPPLLGYGIVAYAGSYGPGSEHFPYAATEFINDRKQDAIVYSTPDWGGFISFVGAGKLKAVIDDRNTMLGEQPYRDYLQVKDAKHGWQSIVKNSGAQYLLLPSDSILAQQLKDAGKVLLENSLFVLAETPQVQELAN